MGYYRGPDNQRSDRDPRSERDFGYRAERYPDYRGNDSERYDRPASNAGRSYGNDRPSYGADRRPPSDYDADHRGFFDRAGDEVRSWFGDEEAERRRAYDEYMNRNYGDPRDQSSRLGFTNSGTYGNGSGYAPFTGQPGSGQAPEVRHDPDYHAWRQDQMNELDRDYHEYRSENREKFNREFGDWRGRRTTQRGSLNSVREHQEVVGSDGEHVGKVDKVVGDRIILAKNDEAAGGHHHAIPSRWIDRVEDDKIVLEKTAAQARQAWTDTENNRALFGDDDASGPHYLNNAFSGTYRR